MNTKLMKRTIFTRTGHKTLQFFSILFLLFVTSSCDLFRSDVIEEYNYLISVKNETNDTLLISISRGFMSIDELKSQIIYPRGSKNISNRRISKEDDPVTMTLHEWRLLDSCWLYKCDGNLIIVQNRDFKAYYCLNRENLVAAWAGPFRYMNDSINNFFNYNSWKSWSEPYHHVGDGYDYYVGDGYVQFTIYESDIQGN